MKPPFGIDDLSEYQLAQIRGFLDDGDELSDEMHALVEKYWPWMLDDAPLRVTH